MSTSAPRSRLASITPLFPDEADTQRAHRHEPVGQRSDAGRPHTCCFVATMPRSGSWLLSDVLWSTGLVGQPHEYFRPDFTGLWASEWDLPQNPDYRSYVDTALSRTQAPNGVFSAKVHWYQFAWLRQQVLAHDGPHVDVDVRLGEWFPDLRHVFLHRRDTARQAISYYRAAKSQIWFASDRPPPASTENLGDADLQQIRWFEDVITDHRDRWQRYFASNGITPLEVVYEDLVADMAGTVRQVLSFLGVPSASCPVPSPRLKAQADDITEQLLASYRAVRDHLVPAPSDLTWHREERSFGRGATASPGTAPS